MRLLSTGLCRTYTQEKVLNATLKFWNTRCLAQSCDLISSNEVDSGSEMCEGAGLYLVGDLMFLRESVLVPIRGLRSYKYFDVSGAT